MTEGEKHCKENKGDASVTRWECTVCEHLYDPEQGDPDHFFTAGDGSKGKIF